MLKKVVSLALALMLTMSVIGAVPSLAERSDTDIAYPVEGGNIYFDPATGAITGYDGNITDLTIPEEIEGVAVTSVGDGAFAGCNALESVTMPSVTSIGNEAFYACSALTSVSLPNVTSIGEWAFYHCDALTSVSMPSVTSIETETFCWCESLTSVSMLNVTSIETDAFYYCPAIESIYLSKSLTTVEDWAFFQSNRLKDVYYEGSEADRENISIADNNEALLNATWHYNYVFAEEEKKSQNITVSEVGEKTYGDAGFKLEVVPDETAQLTNFTFESDNESVAAIDAEGNITIKGAGEANITVKEAGNEEYAAFEYVQKLVVNKKKITISALDLGGRTAEFEGIIEGDEVSIDLNGATLSNVDKKEDGTASVTVQNLTLTGSGAANYELETKELDCETASENIATVTITEASNGKAAGSGDYLKGNEITLTATPDSGYKFSGWYEGTKRVSANATYTFKAEGDTELTAKFTRKSSGGGGGGGSVYYSVKFETDGGSAVKSQSVKEGASAQTPSVPTKDGFNFAGWYADKELTKAYDFTGKVTANITLYAKWTNIETKPEGGNAIVLTIGSKEAKVFGETKLNDVAPIIRNDRTMLPARFVAESLGATVSWNNDERSVVIVKGETRIVIVIGAENATVNGKIVPLDSPAFIENDRTYTPLRFIAESLGAKVEWNDETKTVTITK